MTENNSEERQALISDFHKRRAGTPREALIIKNCPISSLYTLSVISSLLLDTVLRPKRLP
jgi:hypothetical protein